MQIVKLDAIDSTNAYIKRTMREKGLETDTVVVAQDQYQGRGQMGTLWQSEPGKNLTYSVLKNLDDCKVTEQFFLNMLVCLALYKTLKQLGVPELYVKWPNDIVSGNEKICGVLIETVIAGNTIKSAIIGIGLNVNQTKFPNLSGVSSLKLLTGVSHNHDELLKVLLSDLVDGFQNLKEREFNSIRKIYESKLFMKDTLASFELNDGVIKQGSIQGIAKDGKLRIVFEEGGATEFGFKEVKLLY